mmetsp:Transcript_15747/g.40122  ORF Transcript_15747/g.40122 Transcript_15747/m.40122 type:complete len:208 (-) Transcript_15747:2307-2930(-)
MRSAGWPRCVTRTWSGRGSRCVSRLSSSRSSSRGHSSRGPRRWSSYSPPSGAEAKEADRPALERRTARALAGRLLPRGWATGRPRLATQAPPGCPTARRPRSCPSCSRQSRRACIRPSSCSTPHSTCASSSWPALRRRRARAPRSSSPRPLAARSSRTCPWSTTRPWRGTCRRWSRARASAGRRRCAWWRGGRRCTHSSLRPSGSAA